MNKTYLTTIFKYSLTRSTARPDIINLIPMNENIKRTCSSAVLVQSVIKDPTKNTAIVTAEDIETGEFLRCDVVVDAIKSLRLITTTRELFIRETPEAFEVRAYDNQGNEFTTLAGIEFEWSIGNGERRIVNADEPTSENDILKFMTFKGSRYETPRAISMFDGTGKFGSIILLGGVKTGTAHVSSKLPYIEYNHVPSVEVELIVVANLIILPTDITIMQHDCVVYNVVQVHQGRLEQINLSSSQYYLKTQHTDILDIDNSNNGKAYAITNGIAKVLLGDKNVNDEYGVVLPSANVHVANVKYIAITLLPNKNKYMILGQKQEIAVELYDEKDHKFYIGNDVKITIDIENNYIDTKLTSQNGSYIIGIPIACGTTRIKAHLHGIKNKYGKNILLKNSLHTESEFIIHSPIIVKPKILTVPWDPNNKSRFDIALKASGGDGTYTWTSRQPEIAAVSQHGVVRILKQGSTNIVASMTKNSWNRDTTILHVMLPTRLEIIDKHIDAAIGEAIPLHIALYGKMMSSNNELSSNSDNNEIPFTDCRDTLFEVYISNSNFIKNSTSNSIGVKLIGNSCTSISVIGTNVGTSTITISYNLNGQYFMDSVEVTAYEPLVSIYPSTGDTLLAIGSSRNILFKGGPQSITATTRDAANEYNQHVTISNEDVVRLIENDNTDTTEHLDVYVFKIVCQAIGEAVLNFKITNKKQVCYDNNCHNYGASSSVKITCGKPRYIYLQPEFSDNENCPIAKNNDKIMAHYDKPLKIIVTVKDENGKVFDNISSLNIEWNIKPTSNGIVQITNGIIEDTFIDYNTVFIKNHYQLFIPNKNTGTMTISTKITDYQKYILAKLKIAPEWPPFSMLNDKGQLTTPLIKYEINIILVNDTIIHPSVIKILNDQSIKYSLQVSQGSGYYEFLLNTNDIADIRYIEPTKTISIIPKKSGTLELSLVDLCLASKPAVSIIYVQQLAGIEIDSVNKVEKGKCIKASIKLFDTNGQLIKLPSTESFDLRLEIENSFIDIKPLAVNDQDDDDNDEQKIIYVINGIEEGETKITFISGHNDNEIRSEYLTIQVFSPLKINNKNVTLLIGSVHQVLTTGGPSNADIEFNIIDDNKHDVIVPVNDKYDIFEGKSIGKTLIIAKSIGKDSRGNRIIYSQDSAEITVTLLEGIRIVSPTTRIKVGATIPLWAFGIPDNINPLIIGSIKSPQITFTWLSSDTNILTLNNMYDGTGINIRYENTVTLRAKALKPGFATIYLNATKISHDNDNNNNQNNDDGTYSASLKIEIIDEFYLLNPEIKNSIPVIMMTPNSSIKIKTNRDRHGSTSYKIITTTGQSGDSNDTNILSTSTSSSSSSSKLVNIDKSGTIKSGDVYGKTILDITNIESYNLKQSMTIAIEIKPIHYMMLSLDPNIKIRSGEELNVLPKGMELNYIIEYFDNYGNKFHANDKKINTIANRNDLMKFLNSHDDDNNNNKLTILFIDNGEVIVKLYNDKIFDYGHMIIGDILFPSKTILTVGDIVCFSMPMIASKNGDLGFWQSSIPQVLSVDGITGIGTAKKIGHTIVKHSLNIVNDISNKQSEIEVIVQPISKITLILLRGKNITGTEIFSVPLVLKSRDEGVKENNILARGLGGCRTHKTFNVDSFPFTCKIQFTSLNIASSININDILLTKPRFDIISGFYYCDIIPIGSSTLLSSTLDTKIQINAYSRDVEGKPLEITYLPSAYIETTDIIFYSSQTKSSALIGTLEIYGLTIVLNQIHIDLPDGIVIDTKEYLNKNKLQYKLRLIQQHDDLQGQYLTVGNSLTKQNITILIRLSKNHQYAQLSNVKWINFMYYQRYTFTTLIVLIITVIYVWKKKISSVDISVNNTSIFADKSSSSPASPATASPPPLQRFQEQRMTGCLNSSFDNSRTSTGLQLTPDTSLRPFSAFEAVYGDPRVFYTPNTKRNVSRSSP